MFLQGGLDFIVLNWQAALLVSESKNEYSTSTVSLVLSSMMLIERTEGLAYRQHVSRQRWVMSKKNIVNFI